MKPMFFVLCFVTAAAGVYLSFRPKSASVPTAENQVVDIRGTVTNVTPATAEAQQRGIGGTVLIEGVKDKTTRYDKASVVITDKTRIVLLVGNVKKTAQLADLKRGVLVEVVFAGPAAETYPVKAAAKEIVILTETK